LYVSLLIEINSCFIYDKMMFNKNYIRNITKYNMITQKNYENESLSAAEANMSFYRSNREYI
jgi:hypothetical protein